MLLLLGDSVVLFGICFVALVFGLKLISFLVKKEFALFEFMIKLGAAILIGGGLCLFFGRLLA